MDPTNSEQKPAPQKSSRPGYFVVEPRLWVRPQPRVLDGITDSQDKKSSDKFLLPVDGLVIESVVGKWLGKISQWDSHLEGMRNAGYNMIHFVPLQARGASNSPYSIHDQTAFSDDLFDENDVKLSASDKFDLVKKQLLRIQDEYGIMCLSDVVWNHTSFDSVWLQDHPESGKIYSNSNNRRATAWVSLQYQRTDFFLHVCFVSTRLQSTQLSTFGSCL